MTTFTIADSEFDALKDNVVIITGASSGIGLATLRRLIKHGAKVYASDVNDLPEPEKSQVPFSKVDVRSWKEQSDMFKAAKEKYGIIHHVFANAGVSPRATLLEDDKDENGDLLPPRLDTFEINLVGVIYTVKLAIHYIRQHEEGGSIVMTASVSSFTRFSPTDYTTSKHGVYGLLRSLHPNLSPALPIRINAIAPSWTATGIAPAAFLDSLGSIVQTPDVVARSVLVLMADGERHGQMIHSDRGIFTDIESGENGYLAHTRRMLGWDKEEGGDVEEDLRKAQVVAKEKLDVGKVVEA